MTTNTNAIQDLVDRIPALQKIDRQILKELSDRLQPLRYRMGQVILRRETIPAQIMFLWEGQARLIAQIPKTTSPITLEILKPGAVIGWASLIRNVPCETAIASIESICFALDTSDFLQFCDHDPAFKAAFANQVSTSEVFDLLAMEMERRAQGPSDFTQVVRDTWQDASVITFSSGKTPLTKLDPDCVWLVSGGQNITIPVGSRIELKRDFIEVPEGGYLRLIGLRDNFAIRTEVVEELPPHPTAFDIPYAPDLPTVADIGDQSLSGIPAIHQHSLKW